MRNKLIAFVCILYFSVMLTACGNSESNENAQGTGTPTASVTEQPSNTPTEAPTSTPTETPTPEPTETPAPTETPTPEPTETPVENFSIRIIDYLTDSEVVETAYSVDEDGRPLATVTHADGTIQWHTLYEEDGEILWFANVKGENAGQWGGDYKIPTSTESMVTPIPTETPTPAPTETPAPTPEPVHEHNYTETIITEALCNTTGVKRYTCSCGSSYEEEYIDSWNHKGDGVVKTINEATCKMPGSVGETCIYCGCGVNYTVTGYGDHIPRDYWMYYPNENIYRLSCVNCTHVIEETPTMPTDGRRISEYNLEEWWPGMD